ncbi:FtsX-like permease family protein [Streptomyces sp. TRM 70351]|uniref:ABC transporter permease n=1 Tax=Streptomyces sp. TRM 70351 TaxID=3116552 RepID=UPI002E7BC50F|nr:FtsX-like permease family protein [Streptomyces sp. TRM 70351]MEE1931413.1 FtsX-like permease family protein [Streptomyces sp. TRM 70351]
MRSIVRRALADLRAHRGEALFIVLATAGITAALLLAGALFSYAANPWQRVFTQSTGAHVWLHTREDARTGDLAGLDGVRATAGPYRTTRTTARGPGAEAAVELRGTGPGLPRVARPLPSAGRWLTTDDTGTDAARRGGDAGRPGVVLEQSLAKALWARPGDAVTVPGAGGERLALTVVGVAETAEPGYRAGERPGTAWVLPAVLDRTAPGGRHGQTLGLRLSDPADTDFTVQRAVTALGADQVVQVTKWQQARAEAEGGDRLLGLLLGVFGLGALLATGLAAFGAIGARVRGQLRDIAVLKAIGFTPGQVVGTFLAQHLAYALLGVAAGTAATAALGSRIPGRIGEAAAVWGELPGHTVLLAGIPAAVLLFITAATSLAAWRAGRVPPVPAARAALPAGGPLSGAARRVLRLRVPPALVLGWRAAFSVGRGRLRALTTVARLAVPLLMITVALSAWSTLERMSSEPADVGLPAALTARVTDPGALDDAATRRLLSTHPGVAAAHPAAETAALVPGQTGTITLRGLGTARHPYPLAVAEGRPPTGPDEAVAGQGLLDLLDVRVGDWVRMTVEGRPQVLHLVGRSLETERSGRVVSTTLDTLRERDPALRPDAYHLVLRDGAGPGAVRSALAEAAGPALEIRPTPDPTAGLGPARGVITGVIVVLALIGLTELLTAIGATIRDRGRDLLALKAVGLTPRQTGAVTVAATGYTTLAAAVLGIAAGLPAGRWLVDAQGRSSGIGAGIAAPPSVTALAALAAVSVLGAVALAAPPALRAARRRLADSLSETL